MTACPQCGSPELRIHGTRCRLSWQRRWWWFGPLRPVFRTAAAEVSCGACIYQFVVWPDRWEPAPVQVQKDQVAALMEAAAKGGKGPQAPDGEPRAAPRRVASPRPDPRVKPR